MATKLRSPAERRPTLKRLTPKQRRLNSRRALKTVRRQSLGVKCKKKTASSLYDFTSGLPLGSEVPDDHGQVPKAVRQAAVSTTTKTYNKVEAFNDDDMFVDLPDLDPSNQQMYSNNAESSTSKHKYDNFSASYEMNLKSECVKTTSMSDDMTDKCQPSISMASSTKKSVFVPSRLGLSVPNISDYNPPTMDRRNINAIDRKRILDTEHKVNACPSQNVSVLSIKSESSTAFNDSASSFEFTPLKKRLKSPANKIVRKTLKNLAKRPLKTASSVQKVSRVSRKGGISKVKRTTAVHRTLNESDVEVVFQWDPVSVIAERQGVSEWQARQVIDLFNQECTLPFIARYRREKTGDMNIEKLREVQNAYQQLKEVQQKVTKVIESKPELTLEDKNTLLNATSVQEVKVGYKFTSELSLHLQDTPDIEVT